ncbi:Rid family hydrolase [Nonomuraea pusilla]|uniref:Enamine deaminase RidA, house cleaning of reactive enamine intermediates, YjgF/YER057c/UK114 family n=1 Tax=Nonomuraea pusilla TaxID=46177 RepID=A0A1H7NUG6_9ACTN|nr:Rid family hydrolase [Nonomuraea pusilla]SEL26954.1 Enamine deaminase RidA, house cleaning of reactive enamine intermediates, YjgF/YER057c/UK114 family [Nonomuraea pusilla]
MSVSMQNTGTRVFSGGPWEEKYGYARAVVVGDRVIVSGCTAATAGGEIRHVGDAYLQSLAAIDLALEAVRAGGLSLEDVVMVRYYVVEHRHFDHAGRAIAERFGAVRPACTGVRVAGLVDPRMLVEIEIEALRA